MSDPRPLTSLNDDAESVRILPPDYSLKQKIGINVNLNDIFTPERIANAQKAIDTMQADFVNWARKDLAELERIYRALENELGGNEDDERLEKMRKLAFSLKCQSGTFGFALGSYVAQSMHYYITYHKRYDEENISVLRKHIDALEVIFHQNIVGEGGEIGTDLMANLEKLVAKFA